MKPKEAEQIARVLEYIGVERTGDAGIDASRVSVEVAKLVESLGHKSTLTQVSPFSCLDPMSNSRMNPVVGRRKWKKTSNVEGRKYKVPPGEEVNIATHALFKGKEHPDFENGEFALSSIYNGRILT